MIEAAGAPSKRLALARRSLSDAHTDLDDAIKSLSRTEGEKVMATSNLVGLLRRVVVAKRNLEAVESPPNALPLSSLG